MSPVKSGPFQARGTVAAEFESVKILFEHVMRTLVEENAQLCGYWRGEKVVDL